MSMNYCFYLVSLDEERISCCLTESLGRMRPYRERLACHLIQNRLEPECCPTRHEITPTPRCFETMTTLAILNHLKTGWSVGLVIVAVPRQHSQPWFRDPFGTHDHIYILSKTSTCFEIEPPLGREELIILVSPPLLGVNRARTQ
jgi:hypothetical protein